MPSELHFIGTIHRDPRGTERLAKLLDYMKPDAIVVESNAALVDSFSKADENENREDDGEEWFEAAVSRMYARRHGIPLYVADKSYPIQGESLDDDALFSEEDVSTVAIFYGMGERELEERLERGALTQNEGLYAKFKNMGPDERQGLVDARYDDVIMGVDDALGFYPMADVVVGSDHLTEALIRNADGRVVAVGGMSHHYGWYFNLYGRTLDLDPTRTKLKEADRI
ncbi:MAG: hypothetical protein HYS81_04610 [Candidatus Aenigmatarchaeota archaeon]|nr:MAG: hypothetical protein HYS81_04610 [Candidatus Aenigmarchaeota archaeon]